MALDPDLFFELDGELGSRIEQSSRDNWALQHARPEVPDNRTLRRVAIGECTVAVAVAR